MVREIGEICDVFFWSKKDVSKELKVVIIALIIKVYPNAIPPDRCCPYQYSLAIIKNKKSTSSMFPSNRLLHLCDI